MIALMPDRASASIALNRARTGNGAMKRIARKLIYVMLVIVVLLVIWQFLGSL